MIRLQEQTPEDRALTATTKGQQLTAATGLDGSEHSQFKGLPDPRTLRNPVSVHIAPPREALTGGYRRANR